MKIGEVTYDELPKELLITRGQRRRQGLRHRHHHEGRPDRRQGRLRRRQDLRLRRSRRSTPSARGVKETADGLRGGPGMKEVMAVIRMNKMNQTKTGPGRGRHRVLHRPRGRRAGARASSTTDAPRRGRGRATRRRIASSGPGPSSIPKRMLTVVVPGRPGRRRRADDHRGQPDRQARRRQDLRHAGPRRRPRPYRRDRRRQSMDRDA